MMQYGLIGYPLEHSFSKKYFTQKFKKEKLQNCSYELFPLKNINEIKPLISGNENLRGLNVTIPYKVSVIDLLDDLDSSARETKAVNVIKIKRNGVGYTLKGYNSDAYGFMESIKPFINTKYKKALILGTGGASRAVAFALKELNLHYTFVSRSKNQNAIAYGEVDAKIIKEHSIIINCSPSGTYPNVDACPEIPYNILSSEHFLYDLVYNPAISLFLKKGMERGAIVKNGIHMLHLQAEKAWEIWQKEII